MDSDEKSKMLRLMRFWLFGTFVIIFAAATVFVGGPVGLGLEILTQPNYWIAMLVTAGLCWVWFYIYKRYLDSR